MLSETTFGEKLLRLRREKGLSQEALAEMLDTKRQAVSKWENGQGMPEAEKLLVLSDIFGVPVDGLLRDGRSCEKIPGGSPGCLLYTSCCPRFWRRNGWLPAAVCWRWTAAAPAAKARWQS